MGLHNVKTDIKGTYMGIDVGGTKIAAALVDRTGRILWKTRIATEIASEEILLAQIDELIQNGLTFCLRERPEDPIIGVGIGAPGSVDRDHGIALGAGNLPWKDAPIKSRLENKYAIAVYLENDTNAGALGELWFGEWGKVKDFIYIALGTGVGSGIIINRHLYYGAGKAGEVGHIIIDPSGLQCKCGTQGCLETLVSAPAIAMRAKTAMRSSRRTMMTTYASKAGGITSEKVSQAAWLGDRIAMDVITDVARDLAIGLAMVFRLLDPELIILGGGVTAAGERFASIIKNEMLRLNKDFRKYIDRLALSKLGQDSGAVGAAAVVLDRMVDN